MRQLHRVLLALLLIGTFWQPLQAGTVSVAWDTVPGAEGYRVYYSKAPGELNQSHDAGSSYEATIEIPDCEDWSFAVKAYNSSGESPDFSNEIRGWARPVISSVACEDPLWLNTTTTCVVEGSNFQSGAASAVSSGSDGLTVSDVSVINCSQIAFSLTVGSTVAGEPVALEVVNPDQVFGELAAALEIIVSPPAIVIEIRRTDAR